MERGKINNCVKKFGLVKKLSIKPQHKYKSVKTTIHLLRSERTPTWLGRSNINMCIDGKKRFPGDTSLSDIRKMYSYDDVILGATIEESLKKEGLDGTWTIPQKRKIFNNIISLQNEPLQLIPADVNKNKIVVSKESDTIEKDQEERVQIGETEVNNTDKVSWTKKNHCTTKILKIMWNRKKWWK
ncbi:hypothetical protein GLOIN_2v1768310 [Rhizophagus irregularis DAOM 181602=DAOM 197198]|uniref:Uncharacterized protein n=1 Tax=Rhizophagus irregularis (strain DAOM 181602 / DAOM 197198 / MUCL 43194) TaxID=747089 RepID=A0A2P4QHF2_RHIID|nr:hypothetical protein GLOIN_2v1768310 [Rhizophagus irregularis DAOM 181602=DAOM 197198]POG77050.1 hypothetical protein GLOIN_2v1768310 [Rhizophagus irregularis DAOM 181602=DAOM 197198]CAG8635637.1 14661_t:CDS:2 [Rhizophagus irregularis]|eukprot:XP_025183916.1 hypothetical protein GLOIN_2v1768310 [Rhizophagus irregularis DAOM 181602=DAOM 197198]